MNTVLEARRSWLVACAALAIYQMARWNLNTWVYPTFHETLPLAREVATVVEVLACCALIALILGFSRAGAVVLAVQKLVPFLLLVGLGFFWMGVRTGLPVLLVAGALLYGVGGPWLYISAAATLIDLKPMPALLAVGVSMAAQYAVAALVFPLALTAAAGVAAQGALCLLCLGLAWGRVRRVIVGPKDRADPPIALFMNPRSFIPASHPLFTSILLSGIVCGIALTYGSDSSIPVQAPLGAVPLLVILCLALFFLGRHRALDALYIGAAILVLAGLVFFCPALFSAGYSEFARQLPNLLFGAGANCLLALALLVSGAIGRRNPADFFRIAALYAGSICLGILGGATVGHGLNLLLPRHLEAVAWGFSLAAVAFACYNFLLLRSFSFDDVVSHVRPVDTPRIVPPSESFDDRCRAIVEAFALTPREAEILQFYARGRSTAVVQEELVLSYNTVKTHVRNLYRKTDVHSQQELIDLVDGWPCRGE